VVPLAVHIQFSQIYVVLLNCFILDVIVYWPLLYAYEKTSLLCAIYLFVLLHRMLS
jgi:hypothetical protein